MKTKILLFTLAAFFGSIANAQFTTGPVALGGSGMTANISTTPTQVTLVLTGPMDSYLALNFTSNGMAPGSDGFIYNSSSGRDYIFGGSGVTPNADITQNWTVVSNTVSGTTRTVTATRPLAGDSGDYVFSNAMSTFTFAWAMGSGLGLSYHAQRGYATFALSSNLGVDDVEAVRKFSVSDNPIKENFKFQNHQEVDSFKVYDMQGRQIAGEKKMSAEMDASYLKAGVYFLEILTKDGQTLYEKVIKE